MEQVAADFFRFALPKQSSGPERDDTVEVLVQQFERVQIHQQSSTDLRGNAGQKPNDFPTQADIELAYRLVSQHHSRPLHDQPCNGYTLLLAT